jgi:hypothetical protein
MERRRVTFMTFALSAYPRKRGSHTTISLVAPVAGARSILNSTLIKMRFSMRSNYLTAIRRPKGTPKSHLKQRQCQLKRKKAARQRRPPLNRKRKRFIKRPTEPRKFF